jgi:hypothetical protein
MVSLYQTLSDKERVVVDDEPVSYFYPNIYKERVDEPVSNFYPIYI